MDVNAHTVKCSSLDDKTCHGYYSLLCGTLFVVSVNGFIAYVSI